MIPLSLQQKVVVDGTLEITAYYAGHVLGAAMFEIRVGSQSVVYTGDYNMTPDRHLGAAWIGKVRPDLLITESTYATYVRDSKRVREKEFLARLHSTVERGGKVLIPVFALGRVQELCILVETYWQRMNLTVPVYFTAGMAARANEYYRLFVNWTNQKIKGKLCFVSSLLVIVLVCSCACVCVWLRSHSRCRCRGEMRKEPRSLSRWNFFFFVTLFCSSL